MRSRSQSPPSRADPSRVVACGGIVRIANGGRFADGRLVEPRVHVRGIEATQTVEYLRGFLGSRIAWARLNALLIISGAFGIFRRDLLLEAGGFSRQTLGEDMELTMRLLSPAEADAARDADRVRPGRRLLDRGAVEAQRAAVAADPLACRPDRQPAAPPGDARRRRYGRVGWIALPYAILFEAVAPVIGLVGSVLVFGLLVFGGATWWFVVALALAALLLGQIQTAGAILVEEVGFRRYRSRDLLLLGLWSLLELFWYRPLTLVWRLWAMVLLLVGRRPEWGTIPRGAALGAGDETPESETLPLPR